MNSRNSLAAVACILLAWVAVVVIGAETRVDANSSDGVLTIVKTVTTNNVPEQLTATETLARKVEFYAIASARSTNAGAVWLCWNSTNDSPGIKIDANGNYTLDISNPDMRDLSDIYVDVETSGDGVIAVVFTE